MKKFREQRRSKTRLKICATSLVSVAFLIFIVLRHGNSSGGGLTSLFTSLHQQQPWFINFNRNTPIPWTLWQTFTSKDALPIPATIFQEHWAHDNPNLDLRFHNNLEADAFIKEHFSQEVHSIYNNFPLGVMRADLWRYAILYYYGGIYNDIDADCWRPVHKWFEKLEKGMDEVCPWASWEQCAAVVAVEREEGAEFFAQWTIAGVRGHPIFKEAIELVVERAVNGIDIRKKDFVHYYTGPEVWTQAVARTLHMPDKGGVNSRPGHTASDIIDYLKRNIKAQERAREIGLCLMQGGFFNGFNTDNKAASLMWLGLDDYPNWRLQKDWLLNITQSETEAEAGGNLASRSKMK